MKDTLIAGNINFNTCCRWASKIKQNQVSSHTYNRSKTFTLDGYLQRDSDSNEVKVTIKFETFIPSTSDNTAAPLLKISASPSITQSDKQEIINTLDNLVQTLKITSPL